VLQIQGVGGRGRRTEPATPAVAAFLFVLFLVPLWLYRATFLVNWDSVQYALGVRDFDLGAHQPHPPGYIGYEWLGGLVAHLTGNVPAALTLMSVVSGALAPALLYVLARRMLPVRYALAAALLFGFSPLLWHYSGVALTYAPEVALSLPFVLLAHRASREARLVDLLGAAACFALLGSVRQSAILMLAPLWPLALRPFPRRAKIGATAALVAGCLAWTIPLMWASGGPIAYVREARDLADLAVARTAFVTASFTGVLQNVGIFGIALLIGMHANLFVLRRAHRRPGGSLGALSESDRRFLLTWVIVPVLFFILIHTGQPGYALLILPAGFLWVGSALAQVGRYPRGEAIDGPSAAASPPPLTAVASPSEDVASEVARWPRAASSLWRRVGVLSLTGIATLVLLPELTYRAASSEIGAELQRAAGLRSPADLTAAYVTAAPAQSPLATAVRQYSIPRSDAYWSEVIELVSSYPVGTSAVLTAIGGPIASGSFRHLGYYLPSYRVYGIGWARDGSFGYLFHTRERRSNYSVHGMAESAGTLRLPSDVQLLIVPDADLAGLLDPSFEAEHRDLGGGASVTLVEVSGGSVLELGNVGEHALIRLRQEFTEREDGEGGDAASEASSSPAAGPAAAARSEAATP
jgi:hypothetical protein